MERDGNMVYFEGAELSVAGLPEYMSVDELPAALIRVDRLRKNCGASIMELSGQDTHEIHHLHQAKAVNQFVDRYRRLEIVSKDLGLLIDEELDEAAANEIVDGWLEDVPGLALDRLHQE